MGRIAGLCGMRHIALKVRSAERSKSFYQTFFGLELVWQPDPQNIYLSSGCDNIAIHESPALTDRSEGDSKLDHLGFIVASIARLRELEADFAAGGVTIIQPFKIHRDGSASFYCTDPDGLVIQLLYEPLLSAQKIG